MNRLIGELARVCGNYLLQEKWLIAPSLRVGHQWVDCVTLAGAAVVNLRLKTLKRTALDLAGPEMARRGLALVSRLGITVVVAEILQRLGSDPQTYFATVRPGPTLTRSMAGAVEALRLAGLAETGIDTGCFEV
ncbi:MAG: hypothetical protein FJY85_10865, partial [Deltaproteobacteria bacterium]|nr:hypothetical protein [Deltaproteobacteria bacterium]